MTLTWIIAPFGPSKGGPACLTRQRSTHWPSLLAS